MARPPRRVAGGARLRRHVRRRAVLLEQLRRRRARRHRRRPRRRSSRSRCSCACGSQAKFGISRTTLTQDPRGGTRRGRVSRIPHPGCRAPDPRPLPRWADPRLDAVAVSLDRGDSLGSRAGEGVSRTADRRAWPHTGLADEPYVSHVLSPTWNVPLLHRAVFRDYPVVPAAVDRARINDPAYRNERAEAAVFTLNWVSATGTAILLAAIATARVPAASRSRSSSRLPS